MNGKYLLVGKGLKGGDVQVAKLTAKQAKFAQEYLVDLNATQAAIRAGYSPKNASRIASQLLDKTHVAAALQKAMQKREKRTEITQDRVLGQLAKIAFADMKDFADWNPDGVRLRPSEDVDGTLVAEVSETTSEFAGGSSTTVKIKRHDQMKALELLGRHLGMFNDKLRVDLQAQVTFVEDLDGPPAGQGE